MFQELATYPVLYKAFAGFYFLAWKSSCYPLSWYSSVLLHPILIVCLCSQGVDMLVPVLIPHAVVCSSISILGNMIPPHVSFPYLSILINGQTILFFQIVDQVLCLYATCLQPGVKQYSANKILHHAIIGFLNTSPLLE